jgi:hypothetical protein
MGDTKTTTIRLTAEQYEAVQAIAAELGFIQTRGSGAGELPSVSQLIAAIGDGVLKVTRAANNANPEA